MTRRSLVCAVWAALMASAAPAAAELQVSDSVRIEAEGAELHGLLRLPDVPGNHGLVPAVLFLPGGGTQYLTWEPDYFAGRLTDAGIATLVVHKRGTGTSTGDWAIATFEDLIADAGAAVAWMRRHPSVDGSRLGVMGFSQGGRLAPIVAARFGLQAAVGISGPHVSPTATRLYALRNSLIENGLGGDGLETGMTLWRDFLGALERGDDTEALDARIVEAAGTLPARALPPVSAYYEPNPIFNSLAFDGEPDLRRLEAPLLAMYGARDITVPTAASVEVLHRVFAESGYAGLELVVLPESGHGLNDETGERNERYETLPVEWLREKLEAD